VTDTYLEDAASPRPEGWGFHRVGNSVSNTYVSSVKMNTMIAMAEEGLRDLSNPALSPYYAGVAAQGVAALRTRFAEVQAFRLANALPPVSESSYASQASHDGAQETFVRYLNDMGVETEYEEDMFSETVADTLPHMGAIAEVIQTLKAKGFTPDVDGLANRFPGMNISVETVEIKHLREPLPTPWADEDSLVERHLARARAYLYAYLGDV